MSFTHFSHAIHLLQSLDVVCFQSYKYYYCQALDWSLYLSIDWTSLQLSSKCVQKSSRDQLFSQSSQNWSYIIQFWENAEITSQEVAEINVCFYFILSSYILQQIHDLHLLIFQNYVNMFVIYIRLMNILRSQSLFNVSSTVFSMLVLAKL